MWTFTFAPTSIWFSNLSVSSLDSAGFLTHLSNGSPLGIKLHHPTCIATAQLLRASSFYYCHLLPPTLLALLTCAFASRRRSRALRLALRVLSLPAVIAHEAFASSLTLLAALITTAHSTIARDISSNLCTLEALPATAVATSALLLPTLSIFALLALVTRVALQSPLSFARSHPEHDPPPSSLFFTPVYEESLAWKMLSRAHATMLASAEMLVHDASCIAQSGGSFAAEGLRRASQLAIRLNLDSWRNGE
jgi:hypothetical protein